MSTPSPSKRLHLKTSDLTDFFRGSSSSTAPTSTGSSTAPSSAVPTDDDHSQGLSTSSSPEKKRATRIPFIGGRSRKKSVHSDVVSSAADDARESRSSVASRSIHAQIASQPRASTSQPSLKTPTSQTTFSSKIVAHFTPSKARTALRLPSRKPQKSAKLNEDVSDYPGYASDTLSPPSLLSRSPSIDSSASRVSRSDLPDRSSTPRASQSNSGGTEPRPQPTITVSRPPADFNLDNLDEYEDLFTRPRHKLKPKPVPISVPSNSSRVSELSLSPPREDDGFLSSPPTSSTFHTPSTTPTLNRKPSIASITSTTTADSLLQSASVSKVDSHKASFGSDRASISGASLTSIRGIPSRRRQRSFASQRDSDVDPAEDSEAMSIKSAMSMPASFRSAMKAIPGSGSNGSMSTLDKHRSLAALYSVTEKAKRTTTRSGLSQPSKPPSIPLPATPASSSVPTSPSPIPRPRAHTISSGRATLVGRSTALSASVTSPLKRNNTTSKALEGPSPSSRDLGAQSLSNDRNSSSSSSSSSTPTLTKFITQTEPMVIDIENASIEELRSALRQRNKQIDELSSHLLKVTEAHAMERNTWEKKVLGLEKEAARREKEIKGLTWLVLNGRGHSAVGVNGTASVQSRASSILETEKERSDDSSARSSLPTPSSSVNLPLYRRLPGDDSGAESYQNSTTEWGSGTSGAEDESHLSTLKPRRTMRKLKLVESANKSAPITRPIHLKQPGPGSVVPGMEIQDVSHFVRPSKRSSAASSSSSSASSNSPTSVTFPTSQTLIPIPESRPPSAPSKDNTTLDKEDPRRERTPSRVSAKTSGQPSTPSKSTPLTKSSIPSVTPGSRLTPSEAYAKNLKKGRPPSIAQVLDHSSKIEQPTASSIEESYGGRSRALLAGLAHTIPTNSNQLV